MPILTIEQIKDRFSAGRTPRSADYEDLIDTLADDTNVIHIGNSEPSNVEATPFWFDQANNKLFIYSSDSWVESINFNEIKSNIMAEIVASAPSTLDTLNELAAALGDDPNFATTVTNQISGKADSSHTHPISDVTNLQNELDGKSDTDHTHPIGDVTNLQTELNNKANLSGADFSGQIQAPSFRSEASNANDSILEYEGGHPLIKQISSRGGIQISSRDDVMYLGNGDVAHEYDSGFINPSGEDFGIASDSNVKVFTDLQEGWGTHHTFTFSNTGEFVAPQLRVAGAQSLGAVARNITISTSGPSGGNTGDVWIQY